MRRVWCLLHGLGATGAVWSAVAQRLRARGDEVHCPDLAGHGEGPPLAAYSLDGLAAAVADTAIDWGSALIVGHSLGGYVALALADGRHGPVPRGVYTLGSKLTFSADERARMADLAARPHKIFAQREEALDRYRKVSGLEVAIAPDERLLARGICAQSQGWRLSMDPAVNGIVVPPMAGLLAATRCPVGAACGERDPMVAASDLRALLPHASVMPGVGHNAHVEAPDAVVLLLDAFASVARTARPA